MDDCKYNSLVHVFFEGVISFAISNNITFVNVFVTLWIWHDYTVSTLLTIRAAGFLRIFTIGCSTSTLSRVNITDVV